mmetsp:Transcript_44404/g.105186  ORF Transcript_44404/g.105186 Transcript_44404/m.105186 type:complete len:766 (+) Transcript_44404:259-2556(+)
MSDPEDNPEVDHPADGQPSLAEALQEGENVRVLVVKGNLKHRIQKLGLETPYDQLTDAQKMLYEIANSIPEEDLGPCSRDKARPDWCGGGFAFLTPEHGKVVPKLVKEFQIRLQSKHVVVSYRYVDLLKEALEATPPNAFGPGREAFLTRRAGVIAADEPLLDLRGAFGKQAGEGETRERADEKQRYPHAQIFTGAEGVYDGFQPFRFRRLGAELAGQSALDEELTDFLMAPLSIQDMETDSHEMWKKVWQYICEEEPDSREWLSLEKHSEAPEAGLLPRCALCEEWADMPHLLSKKCTVARKADGLKPGRILDAILKSADESDYIVKKKHADETEDFDNEEDATGAMSSTSATEPEDSYQAEAAAATVQPIMREGVAVHLPQSTTRPPPEKPRFWGRCKTKGCPWPLGSKGSMSHCCYRCQASDEAGYQLKGDPRTGEPWKKKHGADCTSHLVPKGPQVAADEEDQDDDEYDDYPDDPPAYCPPARPQPPAPSYFEAQCCGEFFTSHKKYAQHLYRVHEEGVLGAIMDFDRPSQGRSQQHRRDRYGPPQGGYGNSHQRGPAQGSYGDRMTLQQQRELQQQRSQQQDAYGSHQQRGPPPHHYGGHQQQRGPPPHSYGGHQQQRGPPPHNYGGHQQQRGPPQGGYSSHQQQRGPPQGNYGDHYQQRGPPQGGYGDHPQRGPPQGGYGDHPHRGPPQGGYGDHHQQQRGPPQGNYSDHQQYGWEGPPPPQRMYPRGRHDESRYESRYEDPRYDPRYDQAWSSDGRRH